MKPALSIFFVCFFCVWRASAATIQIRVESGEHTLENVIITAKLPNGADLPANGILVAADGSSLPFQRSVPGEIVFVLKQLAPRSDLKFQVLPGSQSNDSPSGRVSADLENGRITVSDQERKVFVYQGVESELPRPEIKPLFKRGGYIHPDFSPSGRLLTDDYPPNHVHHHGIWFPWTKTEFEGRSPDFWNMGEGKGRVEFVKFGNRWDGPVAAGFVAEHRFVDLTAPEPKVALNETWSVTAYSLQGSSQFVFDLVSTQTCASASAFTLPKYYYGGLGFRGNWAWNGRDKAHFLTSEGETNRIKGNETRANWCHIGGDVDGLFTGVAILSHPENFRSPQPLRLHPSEPFVCFAPSQLGDWKIEPGKPYVSRYRFVVLDGQPSREAIDRIWRAYAHPPKVFVETQK